MAHANPTLLQILLKQLDHPRNEVFLHIDKKTDTNRPEWDVYMVNANLHVLKNRISTQWGDLSLIETELVLYKAATDRGHFLRYHLLSGADLCVKTQQEIYDFFDQPDQLQKEYLEIATGGLLRFQTAYRDKPRYMTVPKQIFGLPFRFGSQWATMTDRAVQHLAKNKDMIIEVFRSAYIPDETYKQMVLANNHRFQPFITGKNCRQIRWSGGKHPEPVTVYDVMKTDKFKHIFFARKFQHTDAILEAWGRSQSATFYIYGDMLEFRRSVTLQDILDDESQIEEIVDEYQYGGDELAEELEFPQREEELEDDINSGFAIEFILDEMAQLTQT